MKCTLEFLTGDKTWRNIQVAVSLSRNGNNVAKHDGKIYVWKNMKESEQVLSLVGKNGLKPDASPMEQSSSGHPTK
jgi:hypothetical protein